MDASTKSAGRLLQGAERGVQSPVEGIQIVGPTVGQTGLGIGPHGFVWIQLWRVGRKELEVEPRVAATQLPNRFALVDRSIVEERDHVAPQVVQQVAEEVADVGLADIVAMATEVKSHSPAHGADREPGNDGQTIVAVAVVDPGRLSARSPGPPKRRNQEEPRLVDEDQVRTPARCVFFTCGQRVRFQRSMRSSSRSSARRSGFWGLRPS